MDCFCDFRFATRAAAKAGAYSRHPAAIDYDGLGGVILGVDTVIHTLIYHSCIAVMQLTKFPQNNQIVDAEIQAYD